MAENSAIEWTDHTFNPWEGCQKVGPGCDHCYAEARNVRFAGGINWGPGAPRRRTSASYWAKPRAWERAAPAFHAEHGRRQRVFCASLADIFDNAVRDAWREDLAHLIQDTPSLDWLLLTKRIGNAREMLEVMFPAGVPANVGLGATVVNQAEADRDVPKLLATSQELGISVPFLSMEPLLGPVDLQPWIQRIDHCGACRAKNAPQVEDRCPSCSVRGTLISTWGYAEAERYRTGERWDDDNALGRGDVDGTNAELRWIIVGGESGAGEKTRPMHPDWARSLRDQCAAAGVPFLFKQWGEWAPAEDGQPYSPALAYKTLSVGKSTAFLPIMRRVGKARAGRRLDGVEHNGFPEARHGR